MKVDTLPRKIIGLEDHPDLSFWDLVAFLGANSLLKISGVGHL